MRASTTVILGGGVGGIVAANELRRRLPAVHRIVLVEKNAQHAFSPSFVWVMTGARRPAQIMRPLRALVPPGVEIVQAEARALDLDHQRVAADGISLAYDYLIVALGAELNGNLIPGLSEAADTFYSLSGALRLRQTLESFSGGRVAVVVTRSPYKCPGAPHEAAMLLHELFRRRGLRGKVDLHIFTPEPQPMPDVGPALGQALRGLLAERNIGFHPLHKLVAVNPGSRELVFEEAPSVPYDLVLVVPPHCGPRLTQQAGLADDSGWVPVDPATLATRHERVFAIGDVTALQTPGRWHPEVPLFLPKGGVFAHGQGQIVARRLAAEIAGATPRHVFRGRGFCVVDAGQRRAVAATADFFGVPSPKIRLHQAARVWHCGKVLFEQWWLAPLGFRREILRLMLSLGCGRLGLEM